MNQENNAIPFDPDFDEPSSPMEVVEITTVEPMIHQDVFMALGPNRAFWLGLITAFLTMGTIGFFVLIIILL